MHSPPLPARVLTCRRWNTLWVPAVTGRSGGSRWGWAWHSPRCARRAIWRCSRGSGGAWCIALSQALPRTAPRVSLLGPRGSILGFQLHGAGQSPASSTLPPPTLEDGLHRCVLPRRGLPSAKVDASRFSANQPMGKTACRQPFMWRAARGGISHGRNAQRRQRAARQAPDNLLAHRLRVNPAPE